MSTADSSTSPWTDLLARSEEQWRREAKHQIIHLEARAEMAAERRFLRTGVTDVERVRRSIGRSVEEVEEMPLVPWTEQRLIEWFDFHSVRELDRACIKNSYPEDDPRAPQLRTIIADLLRDALLWYDDDESDAVYRQRIAEWCRSFDLREADAGRLAPFPWDSQTDIDLYESLVDDAILDDLLSQARTIAVGE